MIARRCASAALWVALSMALLPLEAGAVLRLAPADDRARRTYLLEDHGYFLPPLADINAPLSYMRLYRASPTRFTTPATGTHTFWDVGFGEEFFVIGLDNLWTDPETKRREPVPLQTRWRPGFSFFVDGDMHMLLDFDADSMAVIDSDFRIGGGLMGRGLPFLSEVGVATSHLSWRVKLLHESAHVGDEYLGDALDAQFAGDPAFADFRRVNVSYESAEIFWALDDEWAQLPGTVYGRVYAGYRRLLGSAWDADPRHGVLLEGAQNEGQVGLEGRWGVRKWLPFDFLIAATEVFFRKQYAYGTPLESPRLASVNSLVGVEWGDLMRDQMTFRAYLSFYDGLNPRGQFRAELLRYFGLTIAMDY